MATNPEEFDPIKASAPTAQRTQPLPSEVQSGSNVSKALTVIDDIDRERRIRAVRSLPEDTGERRRVAKQLGLQPTDIEDIGEAKRAAAAHRIVDLAQSNKAVARMLDRDPATGQQMSKDADSISAFDRVLEFFSKTPGRLEAGTYESIGGDVREAITDPAITVAEAAQLPFEVLAQIYADAAGLPTKGRDPIAEFQKRGAERAAGRQQLRDYGAKLRKENQSDNFWVEAALSGLEYVPISVAAAATRNPALAAGIPAAAVAGNSYATARQQGLSGTSALAYMAVQGGTEYLTERTPASKVVEGIINKSPFGKTLMKTLAEEIPGEQLATVVQDLADWAYLPENKDKTFGDYMAARLDAALSTLVGTLTGTAANVVVTRGIPRTAEVSLSMANNVIAGRRAKREGKLLRDMVDAAGAMDLKNSDPETHAQIIKDMAEERGISTVLLDGQAAREYLQSEDFDPATDPLAPFAQEIEDAAAAGNDVALPVEVAVARMAGTKAFEVLNKDMRLTAGGQTQREAEAFDAAQEEIAKELDKAVGERQTEQGDQTARREKMIEKVKDKLVEGGLQEYEAKAIAALHVSRALTREARGGRPAEDTLGFGVRSLPEAEMSDVTDAEGRVLDQSEYERILEKQRQVEGLRAALRDPETGKVYTGSSHDSVLNNSVPWNDETGLYGRLSKAYFDNTEDAGFVDREGNFITRDQANERMGILTMEDRRDFIRDRGRFARYQGADYGTGTDQRGRTSDGNRAPLADAPKIAGEQFGPIQGIVNAAEAYAESVGLPTGRQAEYVDVDVEFATRLANAYAEMEHAPQDPQVKAAYEDLIRQTRAQYDALVEAGYTFEFGDPDSDYFKSGFNSLRDLRDNQRMLVFPTVAGFGSDATFDPADNPLLADTGVKWVDHEGNEQAVLANDMFRAVHDAFGHAIEGAGFRARGEENAWQAHARLFTGPALAALTTETRGQNSWLNYGPHGETNRTASVEDTVFADQKTGLLPEWAWTENRVPDMESDGRSFAQLVDVGEVPIATPEGVEIGWTPARIDALLRRFGYSDDPEKTKAYATRLSPDEFLGLTASVRGRARIAERVKTDEYGGEIDFAKMRENDQTPFLIVKAEGGFTALDGHEVPKGVRVMGHEGRHRMTLLKKAGVTSIPVIMIPQDRNAVDGGLARPQRSRSDQLASGDTEAPMGDVVPISYANRDALMEKFSRGRELFQSVWHGSPHIFDRFSTDFMGRGEGNQNFGWGLYFTNAKEIAEHYRETVKDMGRIREINDRMTELAKIMSADEIGYRNYRTEVGRNAAEEYDRLMEERSAVGDAKGRVYEVEIPEDDEFLLWNQPIQNQSPKVREALARLGFTAVEDSELASRGAALQKEKLDLRVSLLDLSPAEEAVAQDRIREIDAEINAIERDLNYSNTGGDIYMSMARGMRAAAGSHSRAQQFTSLDMLREGIAGVKYQAGSLSGGASDGDFNYVLFDAGRASIRSYYQATWFYSALERAAQNIQTSRAPAAQWIATLKKTPGVKQEELEWTGIIDWLEVQKGPVEKDQLVEMIQRGGIVIREVEYGGYETTIDDIDPAVVEERISDRDYEFYDNWDWERQYFSDNIEEEGENGEVETKWIAVDRYGKPINDETYDTEAEAQEVADEADGKAEQEAQDEAYAEWEDEVRREIEDDLVEEEKRESGPKWASYSLAGEEDETYFEWLLTLPRGEGSNPTDSPRTHWDEQGVVIHARGHRRRGAEGKRILFMDELQSDWHQGATQRYTEAKKGAVYDFSLIAKKGGFGEYPLELRVLVETSIGDGEGYKAWPEVAKFLQAQNSDEGQAILQKVEDANRGYKAAPNPVRLEEARRLADEARAALEEPNEKNEDAIRNYQKLFLPLVEKYKNENLPRREKLVAALIFGKDTSEFPKEEVQLVIANPNAYRQQAVELAQRLEFYATRMDATTNVEMIGKTFREAGFVQEVADFEQTPEYEAALDARREWHKAMDLANLRDRELQVLEDGGRGIPDAPFKDTWPVVAMKRMIAKAAAEGYDQIAWIKQGENNGGMDDDVDWFYGRNLPNMVNKLLKPYGTKVKPLYVDGLEAPETPESRAYEEVERRMGGIGLRLSVGMDRIEFDRALEAARALNESRAEGAKKRLANAIEAESEYDIRLNKRQRDEFFEAKQVLADGDALWKEWSSARDAYMPGLEQIDTRFREVNDRRKELEPKTIGLQNFRGAEEEARQHSRDVIAAAGRQIEQAQKNIEFWKQAKIDWAKAVAAGEEAFTVEGNDVAYTTANYTEGTLDNDIKFNEDKIEALRKNIELHSDFDAAYAAAREYIELDQELADLRSQRQRLFERPTNLGFDITPELREAASSGFPLFQPSHLDGPKGRILFPGNTDEGALIELFKGRDLSTMIHESSHLFLEQLKYDAEQPDAPEQVKRDYQTVLDWFKANGHEVRDGIIPVGAHEMFARGGERYTREGKAPSIALQRAFEAFRNWLVNIYKTIRGLNAPITPEIREVFDRLLATDEEIAIARESQMLEALFDDAAKAGMNKGEFDNYQEQVANARADASGRVLEKAMKSVRDREKKLWQNRERDMKDRIATEVADEPVFKALSLMRQERIDRGWLVETFGEDIFNQLPTRVPPLWVDGGRGQDAEVIAERAGFANAREMIQTIVAAEAEHQAARDGGDERNMKTRAIEDRTDAALRAEFGDPMTDGQIEQEAIAAVNSERQGEVLASEIRALARTTGKRPTPYKVAREWARRRVRSGNYATEASPSALQRHRRAITRAGSEAVNALIAGNHEEALAAKQRQMLSSALLAEAKIANEEVDAARTRLAKIAKAKTMRSVDQDYLDQAHALLEEVDLKERTQRSIDRFDKWAEWVKGREADGFDVVVPDTFMAQIGNTNWTRLPIEQFLGLDDAVKQVIHFGRMKQRLLDNKDAREFEAIRQEVKRTAEAVGKKEPKSDFHQDSWWEGVKGDVLSLDASLLKMEQVFDWLDNGKADGVFNRYVFRPIAEAAGRESDMLRDFYAKMKANFEAIDSKTLRSWGDKINAGWVELKTGQPAVLTRQQVVAMALNWGNEGNRQRLVDGYGLRDSQVEKLLMDTLTEQEWAFVQATWDTINELWPEIAALERRVNGVEPEKIEATEIQTPFGLLRGGYYPAIYDSTLDRKARQHSDEATDLFSAISTKATTRASATKARSEQVKRPILLDLGVINRHMGEVIHDITHREAVMQAWRILSDPEILDEVDAMLGKQYSEQFKPWVKYIANRWAMERAGNEGWGNFFSKMRANATVVGMGLRFTTMMTQIAGYANSMEYIGTARMTAEIAKFYASPIQSTRFALEHSAEMRNRLDTLDRDINNQMRQMMQPDFEKKTGQVLTAAKVFAFHGIGYMDRVVSVPTWMAGYNRAIEEGKDHEQAVFEGDKAVRLSQGTGDAKDLASVARGTGQWGGLLKFMTMFYSFMSSLYARQRNLGRDFGKASMRALPSLLARSWWMIFVGPLLAELLAGRGPDDDEDAAWWAFRKMLGQSLGPVPFVRDVWEPAFNRFSDRPSFGYRFTPAQGGAEALVNVAGDLGNIAQGEDTKRATRDVLELIGYRTGMVPGQLAASIQFIVDVAEGDQNPRDASEWFEGLTRGKVKED